MERKAVIIHPNGQIVPATALDNFLTNRAIETKFFNPITGEILTPENTEDFYRMIMNNANKKEYLTTDHLIPCVKVKGVNFVYISFDNSARSNMHEHPLYKRLPSLCQVLNTIINFLGGKCIIFFSEACRPSFLGTVDKKKKITSWMEMRQIISKMCNITFLAEKRNNEDPSNMAFGIAAFYTNDIVNSIECYYCCPVLTEGFGSSTVGVKLVSGEMIWAIHFPIDFKGIGSENQGYKTMVNLQGLMNKYVGSVCAFGDFNLIPGVISDAIYQAQTEDYHFVYDKKMLTFFGSYYDTLTPEKDEVWNLLL